MKGLRLSQHPLEELSGFGDFCLVDLQLMPSSTKRYVADTRSFLAYANMHGSEDAKRVVRGYLKSAPNNGNALRAVKAYFKYLGHPEIVAGFKFPRWPRKIRNITKEDLQVFYHALNDLREKALFLFYASSGLRKMEVLTLRIDDVDFRQRMITPRNHGSSRTKQSFVSFYNDEAERALKEYLPIRSKRAKRLFAMGHKRFCRMWRNAREQSGIEMSCQDLRFWFASEMGRLGVADRYVDAFCGRVPRSILARHYTDYSPERLKSIYDRANLKVLEVGGNL